jgi:WD40 repeat protein
MNNILHILNNQSMNLVKSIAFSRDGKLLASGGNGQVLLWNVVTGKCFAATSHYGEWVATVSVAFSPDGHTLVSLGSDDNRARLWNLTPLTQQTSATQLLELECVQTIFNVALFIVFSPDGKTLASASFTETARFVCANVRVLNVATGTCTRLLVGHEHDVCCGAFSVDGKTLMSGSLDCSARIWNVDTGECTHFYHHASAVFAIAVSPDGNTLACGLSGGTIALWSIATSSKIYDFVGHTYSVKSVAFSPNGKLLASDSNDRAVRIWNSETGFCIDTLAKDGPTWPVTFSPNGRVLALASRQNVILWSLVGCATICGVAPFLHNGVAPYVLLDIVDFLLAGKTQKSFAATVCHYEKISFIVALQQKQKQKKSDGF